MKHSLYFLLTLTLPLLSYGQPVLSLNNYIETVQNQHAGYQAAKKSAAGAQLYAREGELVFAPQLFANMAYKDDEKPNRLTRINSNRTTGYSLGISQQTSIGLQGKLSYTLSSSDMSFSTGAPQIYTEASPTIELSQSLWRNFLGSEVRAQKEAATTQALAKSFAETFRSKTILLEAELAYWRLALARDTVTIQKDAVDRAEKLYSWSQKRSQLQLADRADFLQSTANLQARKLELKAAQDEESAAARAFNTARGVDSSTVLEKLQPLTAQVIGSMKTPDKMGVRDDLQAAAYQARAAKANANMAEQRNLPTLEVFGSYGFNGVNHPERPAIDDSFTNRTPTSLIGLRFSTPLDFGVLQDVREGYRAEATASEMVYQRKLFEQERDWHNIAQKFQLAKERLILFDNLEKAQKTKLDYERDRHRRGRTTTAQVLQFELDYEQSQLGRVRTLTELMQLIAQLKLYEGGAQ